MSVPVKDQSRLIDHFKRVSSLIVGLSLTEACKALFPIDVDVFAMSSLWMFLALFITVIPIFQGGDRYLDVAHMSQSLSPMRARASFMWDVYMLLLTALILVGVARSIPLASPPTPAPGAHAPANHLNFFYGLMILFFFDVFVLGVGLYKASRRGDIDKNYKVWIPANLVMGAVSLIAALGNDHVLDLPFGLSTLAFLVFVCATIRTLVDYSVDDKFMFPDVIAAQTAAVPTRAAPTAPSTAAAPPSSS